MPQIKINVTKEGDIYIAKAVDSPSFKWEASDLTEMKRKIFENISSLEVEFIFDLETKEEPDYKSQDSLVRSRAKFKGALLKEIKFLESLETLNPRLLSHIEGKKRILENINSLSTEELLIHSETLFDLYLKSR